MSKKKSKNITHKNKYKHFSKADKVKVLQNKDATLWVAESSLDLHNYDRKSEIEQRLREFLCLQLKNRARIVEVITGRGNNSKRGYSVLRMYVQQLLDDETLLMVKSYRSTSNDGAFLVELNISP